MKLLHVDIETSPNLAHVWGLWDQNVSLNQLIVPGQVLCWAAKWDGAKEVFFDSIHQSSKKKMHQGIHRLLGEVDAVVSFNGISFDVPWLNSEFIQAGLLPPAPFKQIDLLQVIKKRFKFPSYKLEYVAKALGVGSKVKHEGHELWVRCMNGDPAAWKRMERYNRGDVLLQEKLYHKIRPWIPNHPVQGVHVDDDTPRCPNCGGDKLQRRGMATTRVQRYARYQCIGCGAWSRGASKERVAPVQRVPVL